MRYLMMIVLVLLAGCAAGPTNPPEVVGPTKVDQANRTHWAAKVVDRVNWDMVDNLAGKGERRYRIVGLRAALAETYTAEELKALAGFLDSPAGRSIQQKGTPLYWAVALEGRD